MAYRTYERYDAKEAWGVAVHPSLRSSLQALGTGENGKSTAPGIHALHLNAAIAMFCFSTEKERKRWVDLLTQAPIMQRDKENIVETLDRLIDEAKQMAAAPAVHPNQITRISRQ
jgi:hypothetical protein